MTIHSNLLDLRKRMLTILVKRARLPPVQKRSQSHSLKPSSRMTKVLPVKKSSQSMLTKLTILLHMWNPMMILLFTRTTKETLLMKLPLIASRTMSSILQQALTRLRPIMSTLLPHLKLFPLRRRSQSLTSPTLILASVYPRTCPVRIPCHGNQARFCKTILCLRPHQLSQWTTIHRLHLSFRLTRMVASSWCCDQRKKSQLRVK